MSHKTLISCNTEEQRIRLDVKRNIKRLRFYWLEYLNAKSAKKVDTYWAKCLRRLLVLQELGKKLQGFEGTEERLDEIGKVLKRYVKKIAKYEHMHTHLNAGFGLRTRWDKVRTGDYRKTLTVFIKQL